MTNRTWTALHSRGTPLAMILKGNIRSGLSMALVLALGLGTSACSSTTITPAPAPAASTPADETPPDPGVMAAAYPDGPYGSAQGKVLPDLQLEGYLRMDKTGLATSAPLAPVKLSEVRTQAGDAKYMLIHVSAFWCGICRAAVEDLVSEYPKLASKAIFVDMLEEGETPDDYATKANVDAWVKGLKVPFTEIRDPDSIKWGIRNKIGHNKTALLVELATMKVIARSENDYTVVLDKLKSLP